MEEGEICESRRDLTSWPWGPAASRLASGGLETAGAGILAARPLPSLVFLERVQFFHMLKNTFYHFLCWSQTESSRGVPPFPFRNHENHPTRVSFFARDVKGRVQPGTSWHVLRRSSLSSQRVSHFVPDVAKSYEPQILLFLFGTTKSIHFLCWNSIQPVAHVFWHGTFKVRLRTPGLTPPWVKRFRRPPWAAGGAMLGTPRHRWARKKAGACWSVVWLLPFYKRRPATLPSPFPPVRSSPPPPISPPRSFPPFPP